ncbi:MAG: SAM-dependent methyltransferase [Methylococcaceae bacterium]|nr:SAM-dependent methyltransferase [Methylococcaceae bacterium]
MTNKTVRLDERLYRYLLDVSLREPAVLGELREETAALPQAGMQIAPEQGQFMALLARLIGARRVLEVGVFTGYSSTAMALALPPDGNLTACDLSESWTGMARRYWAKAGVSGRIELKLGPALDTLDGLIADGKSGSYDLAFIDADKENYLAYYERCLQLIRPGGLLLVDNALWDGKVADPMADDVDTRAIRALNRFVHTDDRVDLSLLPLADGLLLACKR